VKSKKNEAKKGGGSKQKETSMIENVGKSGNIEKK